MKINRSHYSSYTDPDGGQWIEMQKGNKFEGTRWRPAEMKIGEEDANGAAQMSFVCEFLGEPVEDRMFEKVASAIIHEMILEAVAEDKALVDSYEGTDEKTN